MRVLSSHISKKVNRVYFVLIFALYFVVPRAYLKYRIYNQFLIKLVSKRIRRFTWDQKLSYSSEKHGGHRIGQVFLYCVLNYCEQYVTTFIVQSSRNLLSKVRKHHKLCLKLSYYLRTRVTYQENLAHLFATSMWNSLKSAVNELNSRQFRLLLVRKRRL